MTDILGVCAVRSGAERRAREDIERAGFGTRVPSYRVAFGDRVKVRPLIAGLVFTNLAPGFGALDELEGIRVLRGGDHMPLRLTGPDEERLCELERDCLTGRFNRRQVRNTAGQFVPQKAKNSRKPRPINAPSKRAQRRMRAKERKLARASRNTTGMTTHAAA